MASAVIHDACKDIGLAVGVCPEVLFVVKTYSQVTFTQLRNESVTPDQDHLQIDSIMLVTCVMGQA